jgi:hypothetical protein
LANAVIDPAVVWVPDTSWRLVSDKRCRMRGCGADAVAELNRRRYNLNRHCLVDSWWAYCPDHLYGRRIVDGVVQIDVDADSPAAQRGYA